MFRRRSGGLGGVGGLGDLGGVGSRGQRGIGFKGCKMGREDCLSYDISDISDSTGKLILHKAFWSFTLISHCCH